MKKKIVSLLAVTALAVTTLLGACGSATKETVPETTTTTAAETTTEEVTTVEETTTEEETTVEETTTEEETPAEETMGVIDSELQINVAVLGGSTGYGAAKLIADYEGKDDMDMNLSFTIETSPKVIQEGLIAETFDIAALSTNKAALLASKTGSVQVAAVNTLGVMYLLTTDGSEITALEDLKGLTVCIPEEPSYILRALLEAKGIQDEVTVETYATPADLLQAVIKGEVPVAVLPEPLLSTACAKSESAAVCLNLTEEWEAVYPGTELMQGCLVVRTAWAEAHPAELAAFLDAYGYSIEYVTSNVDEAAALIETYFGTGAGVAKKAIPNCNMTFIRDTEMKDALTGFYEVLITIPSSNIGEAVPADTFYYINE